MQCTLLCRIAVLCLRIQSPEDRSAAHLPRFGQHERDAAGIEQEWQEPCKAGSEECEGFIEESARHRGSSRHKSTERRRAARLPVEVGEKLLVGGNGVGRRDDDGLVGELLVKVRKLAARVKLRHDFSFLDRVPVDVLKVPVLLY